MSKEITRETIPCARKYPRNQNLGILLMIREPMSDHNPRQNAYTKRHLNRRPILPIYLKAYSNTNNIQKNVVFALVVLQSNSCGVYITLIFCLWELYDGVYLRCSPRYTSAR